MKCAYCGKENPAGEKFCAECGMLLGENVGETHEQAMKKSQTDNGVICPNCNFKNPPGTEICICGTPLVPQKETRAELSAPSCQKCGSQNPPQAKFCMSCGARLERAVKQGEKAPSYAKLILPNNTEIALRNDEVTLGRKDVLHAVDPDLARAVSREHIKIVRENNALYISDLGSTNGTMLDGEEIKGKEKKALHDGATIVLSGKVTLTFRA